MSELIDILSVKMGRTEFNEELEDPMRVTEATYLMMDGFLVK